MENDFDSFKLRLNSEINSSKTMAIAFISSAENYLKSIIKYRQWTINDFKFKIAEANLKVESQKNDLTKFLQCLKKEEDLVTKYEYMNKINELFKYVKHLEDLLHVLQQKNVEQNRSRERRCQERREIVCEFRYRINCELTKLPKQLNDLETEYISKCQQQCSIEHEISVKQIDQLNEELNQLKTKYKSKIQHPNQVDSPKSTATTETFNSSIEQKVQYEFQISNLPFHLTNGRLNLSKEIERLRLVEKEQTCEIKKCNQLLVILQQKSDEKYVEIDQIRRKLSKSKLEMQKLHHDFERIKEKEKFFEKYNEKTIKSVSNVLKRDDSED